MKKREKDEQDRNETRTLQIPREHSRTRCQKDAEQADQAGLTGNKKLSAAHRWGSLGGSQQPKPAESGGAGGACAAPEAPPDFLKPETAASPSPSGQELIAHQEAT